MLHRVRVGLPDRPGALASVARVIAGTGGDVVRVEVVDREAGRAVDEFVIELAPARVRHLVVALDRTPGIDVLTVGPSGRTSGTHPELDLLAAAATATVPVQAVCDAAPGAFGSDLAWVLDVELRVVSAASVGAPEVPELGRLPLDRRDWVVRASGEAGEESLHVAGASLGSALALVVARPNAVWYPLEVERLRRVAELAGALIDGRRGPAGARQTA